jgi:hyperosmotically inducible periplasmic protein
LLVYWWNAPRIRTCVIVYSARRTKSSFLEDSMNKRFTLALAVAVFACFAAASPALAASDTWIGTKAKIALLTADDVSGTAIDVDVKDATITLSGKVHTAAEKAKAEQVARGIEGVAGVKNNLQVVPKSQEKMVEQTDEQTKDKVEAALKTQGLGGDISVDSVNKGVVTLKGKTDSLGRQLAAIEATAKVPGVKRVSSQIETTEK